MQPSTAVAVGLPGRRRSRRFAPQTIERAAALCAHPRRDPGIFSRILSLAASKDWGKALPLACVGIEILAESPIVLFVRARPDIVNNDDRRPKQDS